MGLGEGSSNFRLRTVWTPEMDRYFIDLMLEQVGDEIRGDDRLFSKRAWNHMTKMFNAKFSSKYEKDVLKNRHKMLRNLHRAVSSIVGQKGFRWDETGQMVAADNEDWDAYIQANPDMCRYRLKTVPYFLDLVKIYGQARFLGRENMCKCDGDTLLVGGEVVDAELCSNLGENVTATESLHEIVIDEDFGASVVKEEDIGSSVGARSRTYWQPSMDRYFIQLVLDQVSKGNYVDGLLRKQAWREMITSFNARFGFAYAVDILKNRFKTLRRQHNLIKNLLEVDGFAWDCRRKMVIADDCVWQNYIKAQRGARQYMTRPVPYYENLCLIFRELNCDEKDAISSHQNLEMCDETPAASVSSSDLNTSNANESSKRELDPPPTAGSSKKSRGENEGVATTVSPWAEAVPVEIVVAAIQALPDMDEELVLDACDFLEDEKKAKMFMALDVKLRKKWLMRKLRPSL